jgi:alkylhydroperoxidase/carboxymuconolactone decarboxylase family protein YurZ
MSAEIPEMRDKFYAWANEAIAKSPFDAKTVDLMGLVAALATGHDGAVGYFYYSAIKAGATEAELAAAADIAAAAAGLNVYATTPRDPAPQPARATGNEQK